LSFDDNHHILGFEVSVHRRSPGKAGMGGRIHHSREDFFRISAATGREHAYIRQPIAVGAAH
jgi:hypothetical protein